MDRALALALGVFPDETRQLVRELVDDGFEVVEAWGPVQMAVAHVELARDGQHLEWHTERGFADTGRVRDTRRQVPSTSLARATATWLQARGDEVTDADDIRPHWRDVLAWLTTVEGRSALTRDH